MSKLIIHAGMHKTGTSSLQKYLLENKSELNRQGWDHFCVTPGGNINRTGTVNPWISIHCSLDEVDASINGDLVKSIAQNSECEKVIISGEYFSLVNSQQELDKIAKEVRRAFSEVKIVFYIRRQDKHVISHHQQGSKGSNVWEGKFYGHNPSALPDKERDTSQYHDYFSKLSRWGDAFGDDAIKIKIFEKQLLVDGNVIADFLNEVAVDIPVKPILINKSSGRERAKVSHLMITHGVPVSIQQAIKKNLDNSGKLIPSRVDAYEFYLKYRESNRKLNDRFKVNSNKYLFDEDFDFYPEKGNDLLEGPDCERALNNILRSLNSAVSIEPQQIDNIRDAALRLEKVDYKLAAELMEIASVLRPDGKFIRQKLAEYRKKDVK